tara:strand:- start:343 stop:705 length:363 start_codon:yes stop_codon:yes gene_type:complete
MRLFYRLGYYLAGFSVGLIILGIVFSGKKTSCNYGPSSRVKNQIFKNKIIISKHIIDKYPYLNDSLVRTIIQNGKINFLNSKIQQDSCSIYYIEIKNKNFGYLSIANCKDESKIINFSSP